MCEPDYQTVSVSVDEATRVIKNGWFYREMCAQHNTFETNQLLVERMKDSNVTLTYAVPKRVTFERLRYNNPQWRDILDSIISEELRNETETYGGLGSQRGFYTFVFPKVTRLLMSRASVELWARPIIEQTIDTYVRMWIENRFAPGGEGFTETAAHFEHIAATSTCYGCRNGMANQLAHMDGGCLDV